MIINFVDRSIPNQQYPNLNNTQNNDRVAAPTSENIQSTMPLTDLPSNESETSPRTMMAGLDPAVRRERAIRGEQLRLELDEKMNNKDFFWSDTAKLYNQLIKEYGDTLPEGWADQYVNKFRFLFLVSAECTVHRGFAETADLVLSLPDKALKEKIINDLSAYLMKSGFEVCAQYLIDELAQQ
jgi:hypothetical protein